LRLLRSKFFPYTTLFRSKPDFSLIRFWILLFAYSVITVSRVGYHKSVMEKWYRNSWRFLIDLWILYGYFALLNAAGPTQFGSLRSEEHTSELQSPDHLVC